jgi:oligopeptide transport system ATP-binding protein
VMVMYGGRVMEHASADDIFHRPSHPYTRGLLAALPRLDETADALVSIPGNPPNMNSLPPGCPFSPRCRYVSDVCTTTMPALVLRDMGKPTESAALRACHRAPDELDTIDANDTKVAANA